MRSLIVCLLLAANAYAVDHGLAFLTISCDANSGALGETGVSVYHNTLSSLQNPALMPEHWQPTVSVTHNDWIYDANVQTLAAGVPLGPVWLSADLRRHAVEDIELQTSPDENPEGTYDADDVAGGLSIAVPLPQGFGAGASVRRVHEKILSEDTRGWAFDAGVHWQGPKEWSRPLQAGVVVQHLGNMSELDQEAPELPRTIQGGVTMSRVLPVSQWQSALSVEYRSVRDNDANVLVGVAVSPISALQLRAGYMTGYDDRALTLGFGLVWRGLTLDYGYLPMDSELGDTHKFTFSFAL